MKNQPSSYGDEFISSGLSFRALNDNPELINSSPYDDGWFFKIKPQNNDELEDLLDAEAYAQVSES